MLPIKVRDLLRIGDLRRVDLGLILMSMALSTVWYVYTASILDLALGRHRKDLFGYLSSTGPTYLIIEFVSIWTLPVGLWLVCSMARRTGKGQTAEGA